MDSEKALYDSDLRAAFTGFKFMPKIYAFSSNNVAPRLVLYSDYFEYRGGFRLKRSTYENVEKVDVLTIFTTNNLYVFLKNSPRTFYGNFKSKKERIDSLKVFIDKDCSLSDSAFALVNSDEVAT